VPESFGGRTIVDEAFVALCHDLGLLVHVWTVDDAATVGRLLEMGVDGIMTDRPTMLKAALQDRDSWHGPA